MSQRKRANVRKRADALVGALVRSRGVCEMADLFPDVACKGALQWAHVVSRSYASLRWDVDENSLCACQAHHFWQGLHPEEFWAALDAKHGEGWRAALSLRARTEPPMDPHAVIERLKASA